MAKVQRAHAWQMQAAKLMVEDEVFKKEKHSDVAEIDKTLARHEKYGSIGLVNTEAFKDCVKSGSCG